MDGFVLEAEGVVHAASQEFAITAPPNKRTTVRRVDKSKVRLFHQKASFYE
jgi:hypothetical protein